MAIILSVITWLYLYPLTSNSSSPGGKSYLKRSVDQKVVLQLHIVKLIILGSEGTEGFMPTFLKVFLFIELISVRCQFIHMRTLS